MPRLPELKQLAARMNARPRVERDFVAGGDLSATGELRSMSREFVLLAVAGMERVLSWKR